MDINYALIALSALSQETRLRIFRLLITYGSDGLSAGELGKALETPHNTLSFHLSHLSHAGLITAKRQGRHIFYAANSDKIDALMGFLAENCCTKEQGEPSACVSTKPATKAKPASKTKRKPACC